MTFIPNGAGLAAVLDSEYGMVGRFIFARTEEIKRDIQINAFDYFTGTKKNAPDLGASVADDVTSRMAGSTGLIEIKPSASGHKWGRLFAMTENGTWRDNPREVIKAHKFP